MLGLRVLSSVLLSDFFFTRRPWLLLDRMVESVFVTPAFPLLLFEDDLLPQPLIILVNSFLMN